VKRHLKFQISDLIFQIEEATNSNANANANANADPSPLKGIRDDRRQAFFRDLFGEIEKYTVALIGDRRGGGAAISAQR
jgi:hypothetical protein